MLKIKESFDKAFRKEDKKAEQEYYKSIASIRKSSMEYYKKVNDIYVEVFEEMEQEGKVVGKLKEYSDRVDQKLASFTKEYFATFMEEQESK